MSGFTASDIKRPHWFQIVPPEERLQFQDGPQDSPHDITIFPPATRQMAQRPAARGFVDENEPEIVELTPIPEPACKPADRNQPPTETLWAEAPAGRQSAERPVPLAERLKQVVPEPDLTAQAQAPSPFTKLRPGDDIPAKPRASASAATPPQTPPETPPLTPPQTPAWPPVAEGPFAGNAWDSASKPGTAQMPASAQKPYDEPHASDPTLTATDREPGFREPPRASAGDDYMTTLRPGFDIRREYAAGQAMQASLHRFVHDFEQRQWQATFFVAAGLGAAIVLALITLSALLNLAG